MQLKGPPSSPHRPGSAVPAAPSRLGRPSSAQPSGQQPLSPCAPTGASEAAQPLSGSSGSLLNSAQLASNVRSASETARPPAEKRRSSWPVVQPGNLPQQALAQPSPGNPGLLGCVDLSSPVLQPAQLAGHGHVKQASLGLSCPALQPPQPCSALPLGAAAGRQSRPGAVLLNLGSVGGVLRQGSQLEGLGSQGPQLSTCGPLKQLQQPTPAGPGLDRLRAECALHEL